VVHLDANCHPGRARPDNVVARNQVIRFGSYAEMVSPASCPFFASKQTFVSVSGTSAMCQNRTFVPSQTPAHR
jgi:hypothetical protein